MEGCAKNGSGLGERCGGRKVSALIEAAFILAASRYDNPGDVSVYSLLLTGPGQRNQRITRSEPTTEPKPSQTLSSQNSNTSPEILAVQQRPDFVEAGLLVINKGNCSAKTEREKMFLY